MEDAGAGCARTNQLYTPVSFIPRRFPAALLATSLSLLPLRSPSLSLYLSLSLFLGDFVLLVLRILFLDRNRCFPNSYFSATALAAHAERRVEVEASRAFPSGVRVYFTPVTHTDLYFTPRTRVTDPRLPPIQSSYQCALDELCIHGETGKRDERKTRAPGAARTTAENRTRMSIPRRLRSRASHYEF